MQSEKQNHSDNNSDFPSRILRTIGIEIPAHSAATTHPYSKTTPRRSNQAGELRSATFEPDGGDTSRRRHDYAELWRKSTAPGPRPWNETLTFAADG